MKKIKAFLCGPFDADAKLLRRLARSQNDTSEPPSPLDKIDHQEFWAFKYPNSYTVPEARFLPDGDIHSIVIRFEGEGAVQMKLIIDDEEIFEVDSKQKVRGHIELHMYDGMVIDLFWDISKIPKNFSFYTRNRSSNTGGADAAAGGGDASSSLYGVKRNDYYHVYALQVLGI